LKPELTTALLQKHLNLHQSLALGIPPAREQNLIW
jgi:hypothetical protein